jgi:glycosyltransferase involved in cell wall biosynthesis
LPAQLSIEELQLRERMIKTAAPHRDTTRKEAIAEDISLMRSEIKALSILCLSKEFWDSPRRARKQFLYEALLCHPTVGEVVYVNPYHHRWRAKPSVNLAHPRMRIIQGKFLLPGDRFSWVRRINRWHAYRGLRTTLAQRSPWYITYSNPWDFPLGRLLMDEGSVFFDWTDDWEKYYGDRAIGLAQDSSVRMASGVIVVSERLRDRASALRGSDQDILLLPNATMWKPIDNLPCPEELSQIPVPRIGYLGHLGPWFNGDLVIALSSVRPNWHWVMLGSTDKSNHDRFHRVSNVHMLGQKPYIKLQAYMAHCQVLVAPYHKDLEGDATKLYDYMTLGHPIISTELDTAFRLQPFVKTATTIQSWLRALEEALEEQNTAFREGRQRESLKHTWDARAAALVDWILDRAKTSGPSLMAFRPRVM